MKNLRKNNTATGTSSMKQLIPYPLNNTLFRKILVHFQKLILMRDLLLIDSKKF